jgi:Xaa-Pro dipeptidase
MDRTATGIGGSTIEVELAALTPPAGRPAAISADEYASRHQRARDIMGQSNVQALLVNAGASLRYFTGLAWGPTERLVAMILSREGRPLMICPGFEEGSMRAGLAIEADMILWQEHENPHAVLARELDRRGIEALALDPALPFGAYDALRRTAPDYALTNAASLIDLCRSRKSQAELALIKYAMNLTLGVHKAAARILRAGITTSEVKRFIDLAHRACGADNGSSFCAVQFATASAYPHGLPGEQSLADGDLVLIDTGCQIQGYNSDITRSYVFGAPSPELSRIWAIEKQAQAAAFSAVKPGVACEEIDRAARQVLIDHGLGPDYTLPGLPHRTGHGIGLSIHEGPYLVRGDKTPLAPGMCFSNEPMIVIPDQFGIRLEDHFYVTETGAEWFTPPQMAIDRPFS